jgi:chemotaxis signal transduction protein
MVEGRDPDAPPEPTVPREAHYTFVFRVGGSLYGLAGAVVDHVGELGRIVPVPTAPAHFAGVVHDRGRVLAVVDLARIFGEVEPPPEGYRRRVVIELAGRPLSVLAHEALGLREVPHEALRPASGRGAMAVGEFDDARGVVTLLDADELQLRLSSGSRHTS